jgi:tetraprenyl-beta-curcumene synthase
VRPLLRYHATVNASVQCLDHSMGRDARDQRLRAWAARQPPCGNDLEWWETTAAASSSLSVHVLLALAAKPDPGDPADVLMAFTPWICAVSTLLDSYVDQAEDAQSGTYSSISNYASPAVASERLSWLTATAMRRARALPEGDRYAVIVASMVAMNLSKDSALTAEHRRTTAALVSSAGSLAIALWPILRLLRACSGLRSI